MSKIIFSNGVTEKLTINNLANIKKENVVKKNFSDNDESLDKVKINPISSLKISSQENNLTVKRSTI